MKVIEKPIWVQQTISQVNYSATFDVRNCFSGSVQLSWEINTGGGEARIEASLDQVIWTPILETTCELTKQADSVLWVLEAINYPYLRIKADAYSEAIVTAYLFIKGA